MTTIAWTIPAQFGGVNLEITQLATSKARRVARYTPVRGERSELFDQGSDPRTFSVAGQLVGTPDEIATKLITLENLADSGAIRIFSHPLRGDIDCRLAQLGSEQGNGMVSVSLELVEEAAQVVTGDNLSDDDVTANGVEFSATVADERLILAGITEPSVSEIVQPALLWTPDTQLSVQRIQIDSIRSQLRSLESELRASVSPEAYQALIAMTVLRGRLEQFVQTLQGRGVSYATMSVLVDVPLIRILVDLGIDTDVWLREVAAINSLRNVMRVAKGTSLLIPKLVG